MNHTCSYKLKGVAQFTTSARKTVCRTCIGRKELYLHDLHCLILLLPPPQVRIEYNDVSILPGTGMLLDSVCPYDPVSHPVDNRIVAIGFQQQRRPVEVYGCIVFL
jgi:hypothetical protein